MRILGIPACLLGTPVRSLSRLVCQENSLATSVLPGILLGGSMNISEFKLDERTDIGFQQIVDSVADQILH